MQTNKWPVPGSSSVSQVRSLRKSNNDQVAISVDMEPGSGHGLENEDDDKGFFLFTYLLFMCMFL